MQAADAWHKKSQPLCLSQTGITVTAVLPGELLLNTTGVTARVLSRGGEEMRRGHPQELFQQQVSCLMWSEESLRQSDTH